MNRSCSLLFILTTVFCLSIPFLSAAPPATDPVLTALDVSTLGDGDFVFTKKGDVISNLRPFKLLTATNTPPGPTPTPTPTPTPPNTRSELFKTSALAITGDTDRVTTAKMLATLYREEVKLVKAGTVKDAATLKSIVGMGSDLVLTPRPGALEGWKPFRATLGTQWTILDAKPGSTVSDYSALLDDAATGLESSAPEKQITPEQLQTIIQIIMLILKLFGLG